MKKELLKALESIANGETPPDLKNCSDELISRGLISYQHDGFVDSRGRFQYYMATPEGHKLVDERRFRWRTAASRLFWSVIAPLIVSVGGTILTAIFLKRANLP
jgi:hypothetical protein